MRKRTHPKRSRVRLDRPTSLTRLTCVVKFSSFINCSSRVRCWYFWRMINAGYDEVCVWKLLFSSCDAARRISSCPLSGVNSPTVPTSKLSAGSFQSSRNCCRLNSALAFENLAVSIPFSTTLIFSAGSIASALSRDATACETAIIRAARESVIRCRRLKGNST